MAVTFISGKPGHGKTLFALWHIKRYVANDLKSRQKTDPKAEARDVYYHGINGLTLPWTEFADALKWYELPTGAIIVIDECQRHFPMMSNAAKRPRAYTEIDTHRHKGHDVFLITQDPVNVDKRFTSMCDLHFHLARAFNSERATLYEFQAVEYVSGSKYKRVPDAIKKQWNYPKEVYSYYKSAEVHTYKKRIPLLRLVLIAIPFISIVFLIPHLYKRMQSRGGTIPEQIEEPQYSNPRSGVPSPVGDVITTAMRQPAVPDEMLSIPMYQEIIEIVSYQRLSGCGNYVFGQTERCVCNDQRGNVIPISFNACRNYIEYGYFDYSIPDESDNDEQDRQPQYESPRNVSPTDTLFGKRE